MIPRQETKFVEANFEELLPEETDFVFKSDVAGMSARGLVDPESLMTIQSEGCIFVPVENYNGIDARLCSEARDRYVFF